MYAESSLLKLIKGHAKKRKNKLSGGASFNLTSLVKGRETFLMSVFATLIFQTCLTFGVMMYAKDSQSLQQSLRKFIIVLFVVQFITILILAFVPMHPLLKFLLFTVFAVIAGLTLSVVASVTSQEVIKAALVGTIAIFILMVVFGVVLSALGVDLGWLAGILFIALLGLVLVRIVFMFMKTSSNVRKGIAAFSLLLFGMYIVFDTNSILKRDYQGDFVTAALDYFLDILNTFINLLQLVGGEQ